MKHRLYVCASAVHNGEFNSVMRFSYTVDLSVNLQNVPLVCRWMLLHYEKKRTSKCHGSHMSGIYVIASQILFNSQIHLFQSSSNCLFHSDTYNCSPIHWDCEIFVLCSQLFIYISIGVQFRDIKSVPYCIKTNYFPLLWWQYQMNVTNLRTFVTRSLHILSHYLFSDVCFSVCSVVKQLNMVIIQ